MEKLPENANAGIVESSCCGSQAIDGKRKSINSVSRIMLGLSAIGLWYAVYRQLGPFAAFFTPERTRQILVGKRESVGNVFAAFLCCICNVYDDDKNLQNIVKSILLAK